MQQQVPKDCLAAQNNNVVVGRQCFIWCCRHFLERVLEWINIISFNTWVVVVCKLFEAPLSLFLFHQIVNNPFTFHTSKKYKRKKNQWWLKTLELHRTGINYPEHVGELLSKLRFFFLLCTWSLKTGLRSTFIFHLLNSQCFDFDVHFWFSFSFSLCVVV